MELAIMTESMLGSTYDEAVELARWAERSGLAAFARSDHYLSETASARAATDVFAVMGGLARETSTIRLAVLVSPITFRHPAVLLKQAVTLDQMSGGRFDLGMGTGWLDAEHEVFGIDYPPIGERFARLEEALRYIRAALAPEPTPFSGAHFRFDPVERVLPEPVDLRLVVGGGGPRRTPRLAGEFADELNHVVNASAPEMADHWQVAAQAATAAGRAEPAFTVMGPAIVASTPAELDRRIRAEAEAREQDPAALLANYRAKGRIVGLADEARERVAALREAGVQRFYVQFFDGADRARIEDTFALLQG